MRDAAWDGAAGIVIADVCFLPVAECLFNLWQHLLQSNVADDRENRVVWTIVSRNESQPDPLTPVFDELTGGETKDAG